MLDISTWTHITSSVQKTQRISLDKYNVDLDYNLVCLVNFQSSAIGNGGKWGLATIAGSVV